MIYNIFFIVLLLLAIFCTIRITIADSRRRIIPDIYLFPLLIIGLIITAWFPWIIAPQEAALGAAFGFGLSAIIGFAYERISRNKEHHKTDIPPIGLGDIKLIGTGGIWLGATGLSIALIISCILGMIWGAARHQKYIPFAPFFAIGGFLSLITVWFLL
ncbi:MAG: A24 family peptidase [Alphaproteobacteria bacterium]|nr:A24 family peptidase [Alphaproteobacteria bacterium]